MNPSSRLVLDVGCGDGGLLAAMARRHPGDRFIGLDRTRRRLRLAGEAIRGLPNATVVCADAAQVGSLVAPGSVDEVLVFHPEPCDRPQEVANRLVTPGFLEQVARLLRPGGRLQLRTDHPGYFAWMLALWGRPEPPHFRDARRWVAEGKWGRVPFPGPRVRARDLWQAQPQAGTHPALELLKVDLDASAHGTPPDRPYAGLMTTYERHYRERGFPIYALLARRPMGN